MPESEVGRSGCINLGASESKNLSIRLSAGGYSETDTAPVSMFREWKEEREVAGCEHVMTDLATNISKQSRHVFNLTDRQSHVFSRRLHTFSW